MSARPRRGRAVAFSPDDNVNVAASGASVVDLRFVIRPHYGGEVAIDFSGLKPQRLALSFANALCRRARPGGAIRSGNTLQHYTAALPRFFAFLEETGAGISGPEAITVQCIDDFERWLATKTIGRRPAYLALQCVLILLREMVAEDDGLFNDDVKDRLRYNSIEPRPKSRPRDAYSPFVARALRAAAKADVKRIIVRLNKGPVIDGDDEDRRAAIHAHIKEHGVLASSHQTYSAYCRPYYKRKLTPPDSLVKLHGAHHLINDDLPPLLTLLALDTGLEPACLLTLTIDCLRNPSGRTVEIAYEKRRAHWGPIDKTLRVRDDGPLTPGGLIRWLIQATAPARRVHGGDLLWLYYGDKGAFKTQISFHTGGIWPNWVKRHDLVDDDGAPLRVHLSRLRKTHKALWYLKSKGEIARFALGHAPDTAARHYADVPALRPLHEATVAEAFEEVVEDALRPNILNPSDEAALRADPHGSNTLTVAVDDIDALLKGDQDLWLASCGGFYKSPFGRAGAPCPQPFWGCLECPNAVITVRKLPAILSFLAFIREQRHGLSADDWALKFGRAYARITKDVLPAFSPAAIEEAERLRSPDDIYLPPEAHQ